jgi:tripartite-type tricarboxylate transporter receptor subunit TctC
MVLLKQFLLRLVPALFAVLSFAAGSQTYPSKPIRLIIPAVPGSAFDASGRLMATKLGEALGQPLVPDNRGGAGGVIGVEAAARAVPDGYTLMWANPGAVILTSFTTKNIPFDPLKDLAPISVMNHPVTVIVVNPKVPVSSVSELVELARKNPGKLSYGSAGIGSEFHLFGELFKQAAGVDIVHVPYKGPILALNDVMAERIEVGYITLGSSLAHHKAGKLKILAVIGSKRFKGAPELPATGESLPAFEPPKTWFGLMAPSGIAQAMVARLHSEFIKALKSAEVRTWLDANFQESVGNSPVEFAALLKHDFETSGKIARAAGIRPE